MTRDDLHPLSSIRACVTDSILSDPGVDPDRHLLEAACRLRNLDRLDSPHNQEEDANHQPDMEMAVPKLQHRARTSCRLAYVGLKDLRGWFGHPRFLGAINSGSMKDNLETASCRRDRGSQLEVLPRIQTRSSRLNVCWWGLRDISRLRACDSQ